MSAVAALGWALLAFLWQGTLVAAGLGVALFLLRRRRPQTRYALACGALALCLALPAAGTLRRLAPAPATAPAFVLSPRPGASAPPASPQPRVWSGRLEQTLAPHLPWVVAAWACGSLLLALRLGAGLAWVNRLRRHSSEPTHPDWQARLDALALRLGLTRLVRLRLAEALDSPVAVGLWRPLVVVPAALLTSLPAPLVEALLAHELAHIRRHDYLINLLQRAIEVLLFYHPAVWWISARIRSEREQIADDLAAGALGEPRRLALALAELDAFQLHPPHLAAAAHGGNLMHRIQRLLRLDPRPQTWQVALPIFVLAAAATVGAALHARTAPAARTTPPTSGPEAAKPPRKARVHQPSIPGVEAYVFVQAGKDGFNQTGGPVDRAEIQRLRNTLSGDFLWVRQGGKTFTIQDPAALAAVREAYALLDQQGAQMSALGDQMSRHGEVMSQLGRQMNTQAGTHQDLQRLGGELAVLDRKQGDLGRKLGGLERLRRPEDSPKTRSDLDRHQKDLEAQMAALERQMKPLEERMNTLAATIEAQAKPMEELGRKMEEAGKPMDALGKEMEALGREMKKASAAAEKAIAEAIRKADHR